jgi:hypothetical protein
VIIQVGGDKKVVIQQSLNVKKTCTDSVALETKDKD